MYVTTNKKLKGEIMGKNNGKFCLENLYRACAELLTQNPWQKLSGTKPIAVYDSAQERYYFVLVLFTDIGPSVRIFFDNKFFLKYMESIRFGYPKSGIYLHKNSIDQSYWGMYMIKEELLGDVELAICRQVGFKYKESWPIFYQRKCGEPEKVLSKHEIMDKTALILDALRNLLESVPVDKIADFSDGDFTKGIFAWDLQETAERERKKVFIEKLYDELEIPEYDNPFLLKRLNNIRTDNNFYEISWAFIPIMQTEEFNSYYPLYITLVNISKGKVVWSTVLDNYDDKEKRMLDLLAADFINRGSKPEYVVTADHSLWLWLLSFCAQSGIRLRLIERKKISKELEEALILNKDDLTTDILQSDKSEEKSEKIVDLQSYTKKKPKQK